jgi:hypothetical protein
MQQAAYQVVHELRASLAHGCVLIFIMNGLKTYFYPLTCHFGKRETSHEQLKKVGQSDPINTSFVKRVNLTLRRSIVNLARRSWNLTQYRPERRDHLECWRAYYHYVRPPESLKWLR